MRIEIHAKSLRLTPRLEEYAERAILFSLGRFDGRLRRVVVRLSDLNGPKGGPDKECRLQLDLGRLGTSVVRSVDGKIQAAIDAAADRAGRTVARSLDRKIERRHRAMGHADRNAGLPEAV